LAISGDPVTRPPISSVSRRKFSSSGDDPITIGKIFAAACAQLDASVTEQPAFPGAPCAGISGFGFPDGICARKHGNEPKRQRNKGVAKTARRGMNWFSFPKIFVRSVQFQLRSGLYRTKRSA
jgi:hypothetical protein